MIINIAEDKPMITKWRWFVSILVVNNLVNKKAKFGTCKNQLIYLVDVHGSSVVVNYITFGICGTLAFVYFINNPLLEFSITHRSVTRIIEAWWIERKDVYIAKKYSHKLYAGDLEI